MFSKRMVTSIPSGGAEDGVGGSQTSGGAEAGVGDLKMPVHVARVSAKQSLSTAAGEPPSSSTTNSSCADGFATRGANNCDGGVNSQNGAKRNAASMEAAGIEKRRKASLAVSKSSTGQHKQSRLSGFLKPRGDGGQKPTAGTNSGILPLAKNMEQRVEGNEAQVGGASSMGIGSEDLCPAEFIRESRLSSKPECSIVFRVSC